MLASDAAVYMLARVFFEIYGMISLVIIKNGGGIAVLRPRSCGVSVRPSTDRFSCGLYFCAGEQMRGCTLVDDSGEIDLSPLFAGGTLSVQVEISPEYVAT